MRRLVYLVCIYLSLAGAGIAQPAFDEERPVFMEADQLGYDTQNAIVVARGNVRIAQGQTELTANQITYYQNQQVVRADGNVRIIDRRTDEEYVAERVQLKDELKAGIIRNFYVRMSDNSQFAGREVRKTSPTDTTMTRAVYSPCEVCEEGKPPFWQLKSRKVHIDEKAQLVEHQDSWMEVFGVPVFYTPLFFHPTPEADRKSGFLKPEYSQTSNLGTVVRTPYYINIAPDKDATITPIITSKEGPVLQGEYRQRTDNGYYEISGSVTYPDKRDEFGAELPERELRGHIFAKGEERLDRHWRTGFDIQRATDDTYLRRYDYGNYRSLSSRVFVEGASGRNHAMIQGLTFQGLQVDDDPDREPLVLPLAKGYYETTPGWHGSRFFTRANTQIIARDEGPESRRLSLTGGWKLPVVTAGGHLFNLNANVRGDLYSIDNQTLRNGQRFDGEETRVIPQVALKWRYPLMKTVGSSTLTVEPTVLAIAKSTGNNPDEIPNEDNQIVEFTNASLFDLNPFPGYDRVDEGSRVAYGLRGQWLFSQGQHLQFLLGQSYLAEDETPYPYTNNGDEHFSDYVGRLWLDYQPVFMGYHFRIDQEDLQAVSNTFTAGVKMQPVDWRMDYISLRNDRFLEDREEIVTAMGLQLTDDWRINGSARRDLIENTMTFAGAGLVFQNECFTLLTSFSRQFTRDRDVEPDTSLTVRVSFKNLNEL